jgi:hypothetical protein
MLQSAFSSHTTFHVAGDVSPIDRRKRRDPRRRKSWTLSPRFGPTGKRTRKNRPPLVAAAAVVVSYRCLLAGKWKEECRNVYYSTCRPRRCKAFGIGFQMGVSIPLTPLQWTRRMLTWPVAAARTTFSMARGLDAVGTFGLGSPERVRFRKTGRQAG